MNSGVLIG